MSAEMAAIELSGSVDEHRRLHVDGALPVSGPMAVRVIVLYPSSDEISETEWMKAAATNPAFEFLHDPAEDIYTIEDGEPYQDEV